MRATVEKAIALLGKARSYDARAHQADIRTMWHPGTMTARRHATTREYWYERADKLWDRALRLLGLDEMEEEQ